MKRMSFLLAWVIVFCLSALLVRAADRDAEVAIGALSKSVTAALDAIDRETAKAANSMGQAPIEESRVRDALKSCATIPFAVDCVFIAATGLMVYFEPAQYRRSEGTGVSWDGGFQQCRATGKPVAGKVYKLAEGFAAAVLHQPIFRSGIFAGALSFPIRADVLLGKLGQEAVKGKPRLEVWAMQPDGLIIYDADPGEVGLNLFSDPVYQSYTELLALGKRIAAEKSGSGSYSFLTQGGKQVVSKQAVWSTVGIHGMEWRLVVVSK
jgi:hypothetical protein